MSRRGGERADERSAQVQQVIADCVRRRLSGDGSSDDEIIGRNPELMPELGPALRRLAQVERVVQRGRARSERPPAPTFSLPGYAISGEVYRGGQAVVYAAIQQSTKQRVAIKVMKAGPLAGRVEKARFEREVEILGQLRHPNIVAIHDSGTADGDYYYVMDYISGHPLDAYVARTKPSLADTLTLVAGICDGVHAAHLGGVTHRDLKPGNIRVDANGQPHILDFGLAKVAADASPPALSVTGQFFGSLPWASPEQVEAAPARMDLRTDVYSLGVILYYLLTGQFPYDVAGTVRAVMNNILSATPRALREIRREIDGEVETIVLKCLQKDRDRRYQSAGELARDIRRHLAGEPIDAKRDSFGYVLGKQLRRYKLAAATAAAFLVVVTAGFGVATTWWTQAAAERDRALRAEQEQLQERARAETVSHFLQEMLTAVEPNRALGREMTVREVLDEAGRKLADDSLVGQPHVEATIRAALGRAYHALGLYQAAEPHVRAAVELYERCCGAEHVNVLDAVGNLARLLQDRGEYAEAEVLYRRALEVGRRRLGAEHPQVVSGLNNLAMLLRDRGDYAQAEPLLRDVLARRRQLFGTESPSVVQSLNNLGTVLADQGDYAATEPLFREALELRRKLLGDEHPDVATSLNNLAALLRLTGHFAEAETHYRAALAMRRKLLGDNHPDVAETMNNLGVLLRRAGRLEEAEALYRAALVNWRRALGDGHPKVATGLHNLAQLLKAQRRFDEAEQLHREALAARRAALGDGHPSVAESCNSLGVLLQAKCDCEGSEPLLREALCIRRTALPAGHQLTRSTLATLAQALVEQHKYEEAEPLLLEAYQDMGESAHASPDEVSLAIQRIVSLYETWGRPEQAAQWRARSTRPLPAGG